MKLYNSCPRVARLFGDADNNRLEFRRGMEEREKRVLEGLKRTLARSPFFVVLVELHGAVELRELLLEQLQVGVDEAQLQRHSLLQLLVGRRPESKGVGSCTNTNKNTSMSGGLLSVSLEMLQFAVYLIFFTRSREKDTHVDAENQKKECDG